jgi:hypothetical protein
MKRGLLILLQVVVLYAFAGTPENSSRPQALQLLQQSAALAKQVAPADEVYVLQALTGAAVTMKPAAPDAEQLCIRMFDLASSKEMDRGWNRVAQQKNAVTRLAMVNPVRAMELFSKIDAPQPDDDGEFPEDLRSSAAFNVFPRYWNATGLAGLGAIEHQANAIGDTGEYPYRAMGKILTLLAKDPTTAEQRNAIFAKALAYYDTPNPRPFRNRNMQFLKLLQATPPPIVEKKIFSDALRALVRRIFSSPKDVDYAEEINNVEFVDRGRALLFRAFTLIRSVDPAWAAKLKQQYQELKYATGKVESISASAIHQNVTPDQARYIHYKLAQETLPDKIDEKIAAGDVAGAKALAARLTDDHAHIVGIAKLLPTLAPADAQRSYAAERTRLQAITDDVERVQAVVALAKAAYSIGEPDEAMDLSKSAFADALRIFTSDTRQRPQLHVQDWQGYAELRDLVTFGMQHQFPWTLSTIADLQDVRLKATLLAIAAQAIIAPEKTAIE